jgi:hypothetical protein
MLERIKDLAQMMRAKKAAGDRFVLMLGAGASLSSGVKTTRDILDELVGTFGQSIRGSTLEDRFDSLWQRSSPDDRLRMLEPYLNKAPSSGYRDLAELVRLGYFDTVLTFNFDRLLETALNEAGFHDYESLIRGETELAAMERMVRGKPNILKILKLHGSLRSSDYFLFSKEEMLNYPKELEQIISELTGRDIIICGYAFNDMCVMKAFNTDRDAGSIYFVNPAGAVDNIKGFLLARRSKDRVISGDLGRMDAFAAALLGEVTRTAAPATAEPRRNLFKFLDGYHEDQRTWFHGRRSLTRTLLKKFDQQTFTTLFLHGMPRVGKTSFVRAGLIPYLDPAAHEILYIRCRKDLEAQLRSELDARFPGVLAGADWADVGARLRAHTPKRVVVFLDQFERTCRAAARVPAENQALTQFVRTLSRSASPELRVVLTATTEVSTTTLMLHVQDPGLEVMQIAPLSPLRVESIVRHAARQGGVTLDPEYVKAVCREYERSVPDTTDRRAFTLTHVQTICYYLVRGFQPPPWQGYDGLPAGLLAALESVREESSLVDFLDDLPPDERRLVRTFLKALCDPDGNTRKVLEFLRKRFPELKEDRYPEPIA